MVTDDSKISVSWLNGIAISVQKICSFIFTKEACPGKAARISEWVQESPLAQKPPLGLETRINLHCSRLLRCGAVKAS